MSLGLPLRALKLKVNCFMRCIGIYELKMCLTHKSCVGDDLGLILGLDVQNGESAGGITKDEFGR